MTLVWRSIRLGRDPIDLFENVDVLVAQQLEGAVDKLLAMPEYRHQEKRAALTTQIQAELRTVLAERRGNVEDGMYNALKMLLVNIQLLRARD